VRARDPHVRDRVPLHARPDGGAGAQGAHAAGRRDLVTPLSLAAAAVGADGIIVEVHPKPDEAICDGPQQIVAADFPEYAAKVEAAAAVAGKRLSAVPA
jgi:3-deoxy-7-phosphoheptulonate synthase